MIITGEDYQGINQQSNSAHPRVSDMGSYLYRELSGYNMESLTMYLENATLPAS
jgi:hypothetical protein